MMPALTRAFALASLFLLRIFLPPLFAADHSQEAIELVKTMTSTAVSGGKSVTLHGLLFTTGCQPHWEAVRTGPDRYQVTCRYVAPQRRFMSWEADTRARTVRGLDLTAKGFIEQYGFRPSAARVPQRSSDAAAAASGPEARSAIDLARKIQCNGVRLDQTLRHASWSAEDLGGRRYRVTCVFQVSGGARSAARWTVNLATGLVLPDDEQSRSWHQAGCR